MKAVVQACIEGRLKAEACLLISNNADCEAMSWPNARAIKCLHFSSRAHSSLADLDLAIADAMTAGDVSLIVLSGYMRKLGPRTVKRYKARILSIHPALLPKHGGQGMYGDRVHSSVLAAGDKVSGATVHLVDEEYDHGPTVAQSAVPILSRDTVESLGARSASKSSDC